MGIVSGGGGGAAYTPPTGRAIYNGNALSIADNATDSLTWNTLDSGSALLDIITDVQSPTVVTAGIYTVAVVFLGSALTVGGLYRATLILDGNVMDAEVSADSPSSIAAQQSPRVTLVNTFYIPALGVVKANVLSKDGSAARNFTLFIATVQRLT